jgi:hypothetical protein
MKSMNINDKRNKPKKPVGTVLLPTRISKEEQEAIQYVAADSAERTSAFILDVYKALVSPDEKGRLLGVVEKHFGSNVKNVLVQILTEEYSRKEDEDGSGDCSEGLGE